MGRNVACLAFLVCLGCGQKPPEPVEVRGKVQHGGKAVANVLLRLQPENPRARLVDQLTQSDGSFEVKCLPGKYHAFLLQIPTKGGDPIDPTVVAKTPGKTPAAKLPAAYLNASSSPWRDIDIPATGRPDLILEVKD